MGLIYGVYDAKRKGLRRAASACTNMMLPHGPDREAFDHASNSELKPVNHRHHGLHVRDALPQRVTEFAVESATLQDDYAGLLEGTGKAVPSDKREIVNPLPCGRGFIFLLRII